MIEGWYHRMERPRTGRAVRMGRAPETGRAPGTGNGAFDRPSALGGGFVDTVAANGDRDLREMLDWAITQAPVDIALLDTQMRQLRLNASLCRALGLDHEAAGLGLRITDLLSNPATESCLAAARMVARTGKPTVWRGVNQMPGQVGDHAMDIHLSPVKDPAGRVCAVLVEAVD
jgi:PAS domain-containing protein